MAHCKFHAAWFYKVSTNPVRLHPAVSCILGLSNQQQECSFPVMSSAPCLHISDGPATATSLEKKLGKLGVGDHFLSFVIVYLHLVSILFWWGWGFLTMFWVFFNYENSLFKSYLMSCVNT